MGQALGSMCKCIRLFHPPNNPHTAVGPIESPFYYRGNWGLEGIRNIPYQQSQQSLKSIVV